jgi:tRNA threonylcarbamoyladenosine biosynthesis protein TsaB
MILAIETATAACSVALIDNGRVIAAAHEMVGRGHAERLIPMIAALPNGGRADHIVAGCGPGSFTGIRVGLAAARGLAIAWQATVSGYSTLALIAAGYFRENEAAAEVFVVNEAGHGEVFMEGFSYSPFESLAPLISASPQTAAGRLKGRNMVGSGAPRLREFDVNIVAKDFGPDVRNLVLLPTALVTLAVQPIYGRDPDAKPPA